MVRCGDFLASIRHLHRRTIGGLDLRRTTFSTVIVTGARTGVTRRVGKVAKQAGGAITGARIDSLPATHRRCDFSFRSFGYFLFFGFRFNLLLERGRRVIAEPLYQLQVAHP